MCVWMNRIKDKSNIWTTCKATQYEWEINNWKRPKAQEKQKEDSGSQNENKSKNVNHAGGGMEKKGEKRTYSAIQSDTGTENFEAAPNPACTTPGDPATLT